MRFTHWMIVAITATGFVTASSAQPQSPIYKDSHQPVERRVEDLLARMLSRLRVVAEHQGLAGRSHLTP